MFIKIECNECQKYNELDSVLSNIGYLMNNIEINSFLNLLDKNMEYITSLLIKSMVIGNKNLETIISDNFELFVKQYEDNTLNIAEGYTKENVSSIMLELINMIICLNKIYSLDKGKICFFDKLKGTKWFTKKVLLKPIEDLYLAYYSLYKYFPLNQQVLAKVSDNTLNFVIIIDNENKIINPMEYI